MIVYTRYLLTIPGSSTESEKYKVERDIII